jgi:hypothetical protein
MKPEIRFFKGTIGTIVKWRPAQSGIDYFCPVFFQPFLAVLYDFLGLSDYTDQKRVIVKKNINILLIDPINCSDIRSLAESCGQKFTPAKKENWQKFLAHVATCENIFCPGKNIIKIEK